MSDKANEISVDGLEGVAGGSIFDSEDDAKRFADNQIKVDYRERLPSERDFTLTVGDLFALQNAFLRFGVRVRNPIKPNKANQYFIDGKEVTREEAWQHIESQIKH